MPILSFSHAVPTSSRVLAALATAALVAGGVLATATPAEAAPTRTWDRLAQCESSGDWHIDTGNGYYGGLQFSMSTWHAHGGAGNPARATKSTQIHVAEKVLSSQGWGAWPACSSRLGLHGKPAAAHQAKRSVTKKAQHAKPVKVSERTVVVRSGDTLTRIAGRMHVQGGWKRLAQANPQLRNPDVLRVGQRLHLPA